MGSSSAPASTCPGAIRNPDRPDPNCCVMHKVVIDLDDDFVDASDGSATTDPATETAEDDYESIKANKLVKWEVKAEWGAH